MKDPIAIAIRITIAIVCTLGASVAVIGGIGGTVPAFYVASALMIFAMGGLVAYFGL